MRRRIFNIVLLLTSFCLMLSISFGWWIEGVISDSFIIKSANISSEITLYKGMDFNLDGNLDKIDTPFTVVQKTEKSKDKKVLVLDFGRTIPTEIHTWKIMVENNGDAAGYVYATLFDELTDDQKKLIKYMSISEVSTNVECMHYLSQDGTAFTGKIERLISNEGSKTDSKFTYNGTEYDVYQDTDGNKYFVAVVANYRKKVYLYNATSTTALFGNTDLDIVGIGQKKEYIFQIQLEAFDDLVINNIIVDDANTTDVNEIETERALYQALQGVTTSVTTTFEFLDVSLSSTKIVQGKTTE